MAANQIGLSADSENVRSLSKQSSLWEYLALAMGTIFVVLLFSTLATAPEPPTAWARDSKLIEWYIKYHDISLVNTFLRSLAAFSMLIFICGVISRIRRAEGYLSVRSLNAFAGAVSFTLVMFISLAADATAALLASSGGGPETVRAVDALGDTLRHFNSLSGALMIGAVSAGLLRARVVPRPVGWLGFIGATAFLAGAAGFPGTSLEFLNAGALPFLPLWPVVLSITLLLNSARKRSTPKAAT